MTFISIQRNGAKTELEEECGEYNIALTKQLVK